MNTKVCIDCKREFPLDHYQVNGPSSSGKPRWKPRCRTCMTKYQNNVFYTKLFRAIGGEHNYKCTVCGYAKSRAAIDFHHRDPSTKDIEVTKLKNRSYDVIKREVDKCDILCANCHRETHEKLHAGLAD